MKGQIGEVDSRFPENFIAERFGASEDLKAFIELCLVLAGSADKSIKHHLGSFSLFHFYKLLFLFCPCFVPVLVWVLPFNNSCKSKLIGTKSIGQVIFMRMGGAMA